MHCQVKPLIINMHVPVRSYLSDTRIYPTLKNLLRGHSG